MEILKTRLFLVVVMLAVCRMTSAQGVDCKGKAFICVDSTRFLVCVSTIGTSTVTVDNIPQSCPATTTCSNSAQLECTIPGSATTVAPVKPPECPRLGAFGDPTDCHVFYKCLGPVKLKFTCPLNTVFSNTIFLCTTNQSACPTGTDFKCKTAGNFKDPQSCKSYYSCTASGAGFTQTKNNCPLLNSFNPVTSMCRFGILDCIGL